VEDRAAARADLVHGSLSILAAPDCRIEVAPVLLFLLRIAARTTGTEIRAALVSSLGLDVETLSAVITLEDRAEFGVGRPRLMHDALEGATEAAFVVR
jgi:hypothetical protein